MRYIVIYYVYRCIYCNVPWFTFLHDANYTRQGCINYARQGSELYKARLHGKAVALLDLLQRNLPDKTGEKRKWKFEKAHSILHKVREIILWGNSDNYLCQSPGVCICTWYILLYTMYIVLYISIRLYILCSFRYIPRYTELSPVLYWVEPWRRLDNLWMCGIGRVGGVWGACALAGSSTARGSLKSSSETTANQCQC